MNVLVPPCRLCGEAHAELSCTQYRTPDERQSQVRSLNRCTQCLDAKDLDHIGNCPYDRRCLKCSGAHHEALCAVHFTAPIGTSQHLTSAPSNPTALESFRFTSSKPGAQPPAAPLLFTPNPVKPKFHPGPPVPEPNSKTDDKNVTLALTTSSVNDAPESGSQGNTGTMASSGGPFGQNTPSLFGSGQQSAFGATTPSTGLFRSGIASVQGAPVGTTIKFDAPRAKDDMMIENNETRQVDTRHVCITAMREYEAKSLEELRVEDYLANRKSGKAGGTSRFGIQQAAPSFGSTAGTTGACTLSQAPSAKLAQPRVPCASSTSAPIPSKPSDVRFEVKAPPVQQPTSNLSKCGASLRTACSTPREAEDPGQKLAGNKQHNPQQIKTHAVADRCVNNIPTSAPLCPCVFCVGWHWPHECWRVPKASQRRGILRRNGRCVRCMQEIGPHHKRSCHETFPSCPGCGKTDHRYAVCLTAFGTAVSRTPSKMSQPTTPATSSIATARQTTRSTIDPVVSRPATITPVQPSARKAVLKSPTVSSSPATQAPSVPSNKGIVVETVQNSKQDPSSSKSQVHTRSTHWKTVEAPRAPSEQAVKADTLVNALPTIMLTSDVVQVRKASCGAALVVVPSVIAHNVSMKLAATCTKPDSTLCAASNKSSSPTLEGAAGDATNAGTANIRHRENSPERANIRVSGCKRKAEDNARLGNDGQTKRSVCTAATSNSDKNAQTNPLQTAPSSGVEVGKQAKTSQAVKSATPDAQERSKQDPKLARKTTIDSSNSSGMSAKAVAALTRADQSGSATMNDDAVSQDAVEEPARSISQMSGHIQPHSVNISASTNVPRVTSDGSTPLFAALRSPLSPTGTSLERPSTSGTMQVPASSPVPVENGDNELSKSPEENSPSLATSSTSWTTRFNDVARRARENAQKTLADGLQKLFEQAQVLEAEREDIFEAERRELDAERAKLTEMKADVSKLRMSVKIKEMKLTTKERRLRDWEQKVLADQRSIDVAREDLVIDRLNMEEERRERLDTLPNYEQHVHNERILAEYRLQLEAKEASLQQRAQELEGIFVDLQQQKAALEEEKVQKPNTSKTRSRSPNSSSRRSSLENSEASSSSSQRHSSLRDAEEEIRRLKRRLKDAREDADDAHRELRCIKEKRGDDNPRRRDAVSESLRRQLDEAKQRLKEREEALSRAKSERCAAELKADEAEKKLAEQKEMHSEQVDGMRTEIEILQWSLEFRRQRSERKIREAKAKKQQQMRQKNRVAALSAKAHSGTAGTARVRIKPEVRDDGYGDVSCTTEIAVPANAPRTVPASGQSSDRIALSTIAGRKLELAMKFPEKLVDKYLAFLNANVTMAVHVRELVEFLKQKDPENLALSEAIVGMCDEAVEDLIV